MNETSFLEHVAKDLLSKHGTDLSRMAWYSLTSVRRSS